MTGEDTILDLVPKGRDEDAPPAAPVSGQV